MCRSSGDQDGIAARRPRGASVAPRFTLIVADPDLAASRSIGREGDPQSITGKEGKLYVCVEAIHREGMWVETKSPCEVVCFRSVEHTRRGTWPTPREVP